MKSDYEEGEGDRREGGKREQEIKEMTKEDKMYQTLQCILMQS